MTDNSKQLSKINQIFHNKGIKQDNRLELFLTILHKYNNNTITDGIEKDVKDILDKIDLTNIEFIQECFMELCSNFTKYKLDQFYTPITISSFITELLVDGNIAIEPACGTGDLINHYKGTKYLWDIDAEVLKLCELNLSLYNNKNYKIENKNSLLDFEKYINTASYVIINPPFGSNTITDDITILDKYILGKGKKKQELGILFLELGLKLLKNDGILFIILPSGYGGNKNKSFKELRNIIINNYKILGIIEFPKNTFKRSGTGVDTCMWIIQKKEIINKPYNIFIERVENIGYDLTKKNTPCKYKINTDSGEYILDKNNNKIIDNDFTIIVNKFKSFCKANNIINIKDDIEYGIEYDYISIDKLDGNILDIKRYSSKYLNIVKGLCNTKTIKQLATIYNKNEKIEKNKKYLYIDIGEINTPLYTYKELFGWQLPSRAKYIVKRNDILVSRLDGKISYTVICEDKDNIIVSNGICVIRPKNIDNLYIIFTNILREHFKLQHNAYTTGSIMATILDSDIEKILIDCDEDTEISKKIIDTITILRTIY